MILPDSQRDLVMAMSPCGSIEPSPRIAGAARAAGGLGVLDLGQGDDWALSAIELAEPWSAGPIGVRVPGGCGAAIEDVRRAAAGAIALVVLAHGSPWRVGEVASRYRVVVEAASLAEARVAAKAGAAGLVLRGLEGGGRVSDLTSFILLQRVLADGAIRLPLWVAGGIGPRTAAACVLGGAAGVVLDSQLALMPESDLPGDIRAVIGGMDGSETVLAAGWRGVSRDLRTRVRVRRPGEGEALPGAGTDPAALLPVGQDGWLAGYFASRWPDTGAAVRAIRKAVLDAVDDDASGRLLESGSALARRWGTRIPVAQGPMTRVSDQVPFVAAVASDGALPFVALALSDAEQTRRTLEEAAAALADRPWGVGVLGFAPDSVRAQQLELIRQIKPACAIVAGGTPPQAKALEEAGIPAYLHVPSPGLLRQFLRSGARRFVFEGAECGGHVGPRTSLSLWEGQLSVLDEFLDHQPDSVAGQLEVLFAGGVHDARSAAMAAAMAAPLARRGARIGVLMGTAYLFTKEAVDHGAIQPVFQRYALAAEQTALLQTAPGHATRCLRSPFAEEFERQRAELESSGLERREVWERLELLNLGRLRIASKAKRRDGAALVTVDEATQEAEGLFMAGQAAVLRDSPTTVAVLHDEVSRGSETFYSARQSALREELDLGRVPAARPTVPTDVAIVGMSCVFPKSPDLASYWRTIVGGLDQISEIPAERWNVDTFYSPQQDFTKCGQFSISKWGGFLAPTPFDPIKYGIPPATLGSIDPQQLLALETAHRALLDAGYGSDTHSADHSRTGVVFAAQAGSDMGSAILLRTIFRAYFGELPDELDGQLPEITSDTFPGNLPNVIPGRIANRLNLGGPNFTVDAACASSLAAVDVACKELVSGTSDMMLCGAVDLHSGINDYIMFTSAHALSPSGRCRAFDSAADGTTLGEGVACLVLKRLADAERDGDRVYAVIKGIGSASDGRALGLTAPRPEGQQLVLKRAYGAAGISPRDVGLIEAHGTGTVAGDRTELESLTRIFSEAGAQPGSCTLGSVKSQIGHTKCAAGLAGLIKAALSIHAGVLPPTINLTKPNTAWDPVSSPFVFSGTSRPWTSPVSKRVAGISAFGFGGTNFHAVLAGHSAGLQPAHYWDEWPAELFCFRGVDRQAAHRAVGEFMGRLAHAGPRSRPVRLRDLAVALSRESSPAEGPVQLAVVASGAGELEALLHRALAGEHDPSRGLIQPAATPWADPPKVALLFPGQGSQRPGALRELFVVFPEIQRFLGGDAHLAGLMFPSAAFDGAAESDQQARLRDTAAAQPALGISGLALGYLLRRLGIGADMAGGHSYGELVALCAAGAFDDATLLELSSERADSILAAISGDAGTMAAVSASAETVSAVLADAGLAGDVVVANHNAPTQVVISGKSPAVDDALTALRSAGLSARRLEVACAFHSPVVAAARDRFARALDSRPVSAPRIPVWSNRTAAPYPSDPDLIRRELAEHIVSPVLFGEQIQSMYDHGARVFVEVGPGKVLSRLTGTVLGDRPHLAVACAGNQDQGLRGFLQAIAQLACAGLPVELGWLFRGRGVTGAATAPVENRQTWTVDGMAVRDGDGAYLPGGMTEARPVKAAISGRAEAAGDSRIRREDHQEAILTEFLRTSREMVASQRDVVLAYFGERTGGRLVWQADPAPGPAAAPGLPTAAPAVPLAGLPGAVEEPSMRTAAADENGGGLPDLTTTILDVIAERTGYPVDLIEMDLDLEADLSIDSIKRAEIGGEVAARMGVVIDGGVDLQDVFRARTVRAMVDNLASYGDLASCGEAQPADPPASAAEPLAGHVPLEPVRPHDVGSTPARLIPVQTEVPGASANSPAELAGASFLITGDSAMAVPVAERLRAVGAVVRTGALDEPPDRHTDVDGLLCLDGLANAGSPLACSAFPLIRQALRAGVRWLIAVAGPPGEPHTAGLTGLFRTIKREHQGLTSRLVNVEDPVTGEQLAGLLVAELLTASRDAAVVYRGGRRHTVAFTPAELDMVVTKGSGPRGDGRAETDALGLDRNSVIVLFGGGRGITAWTARALAASSRCHVELAGRTPLIEDPDDEDIAAATGKVQLRSALARRGMRTAAEIEHVAQQILARREIRATIAELRAIGSQVRYHAVDVSDVAATKLLIKEIYGAHGRIDGVVHGAGVIEDRLIVDKDPESFARMFSTKVAGANAILAGLDSLACAPKFTVFFGSTAAVYGNRGQGDYAAANDALESVGARWAARTGQRCLTVHWGPWSPVGEHPGMVSPELYTEYQRRGIELIDPEAGALSLLRELAWGDPAATSVIYTTYTP
jgi:acyl transferase domain-containing protein/NAD(P)H-dependent flavin oxidoreductase YrpB (nitropropane dioxygenase family)/acyl carrier protein